MTRAQRWLLGGLFIAFLPGLMWGLASIDRCGQWPAQNSRLTDARSDRGALLIGCARIALAPPLPIVVGGYGPIRSDAEAVSRPLFARALVAEVGSVTFGLVALDLLLVPEALVEAIRRDFPFPVWVVATHTHSSFGGFDRRPVAQLAALGAHRTDAESELVSAARQALTQAMAAKAPAHLELAQGLSSGLSQARSGDVVDQRLTRVRFLSPTGAPRAQWLLLAAHPALVERRTERLHPDYPGCLALDAEDEGVTTFVLQASGGNASAVLLPGESAEDFARRARVAFAALEPLTADPGAPMGLALATVRLPLPRPDGSRVAGPTAHRAVENALCDSAERTLELSVLRMGGLSLLAAPLESTAGAGEELERRAGVTRVIGPANGYLGYLETERLVRAGGGEARRQYFGPELLELAAQAAHQAGQAASQHGN